MGVNYRRKVLHSSMRSATKEFVPNNKKEKNELEKSAMKKQCEQET